MPEPLQAAAATKPRTMASIRDIGERIFKSPQAWAKLLIGGLLPWTIVGIPLVFGYFFVYAWQLRQAGPGADVSLPRWENWGRLYRIGLESFVIALVWWFVPLLILCGIASVLLHISDLLKPFAYIIRMAAMLAGPFFYISALTHYQGKRDYKAVLEVQAIVTALGRNWAALVVPGLVWLGLLTLALPLFPWVVFLGVLLGTALLTPLLLGGQGGSGHSSGSGSGDAEGAGSAEAPQYISAGRGRRF